MALSCINVSEVCCASCCSRKEDISTPDAPGPALLPLQAGGPHRVRLDGNGASEQAERLPGRPAWKPQGHPAGARLSRMGGELKN